MERLSKLFLGGGGDENQSALFDDEFFKYVKGDLVYIPIAMTSRPYGDCLKWFQRVVSDRAPIHMWTNLYDRSLSDLITVNAVYIGGGDTGKLLDHVVKSGFHTALKAYLKQGGIVYGGSAGAIILGQDIRTAREVCNTARVNYDGLNLLEGYSVYCHYQGTLEEQELIERLVSELNTSILTIPEETGLLVKDYNIRVIGNKNAIIFNPQGSIITEVGKTYSLK